MIRIINAIIYKQATSGEGSQMIIRLGVLYMNIIGIGNWMERGKISMMKLQNLYVKKGKK